jgi:hypothetical protein
VVLKRSEGAADAAEIGLHVRGGAHGLTVGARD